jgi:hypothetical protein
MKHVVAKIGGWSQFILTLVSTLANNQPHGWAQWLTAIASGAAAIGIHAASNTDGTK